MRSFTRLPWYQPRLVLACPLMRLRSQPTAQSIDPNTQAASKQPGNTQLDQASGDQRTACRAGSSDRSMPSVASSAAAAAANANNGSESPTTEPPPQQQQQGPAASSTRTIKAVIYDLDGTLLDTEALSTDAIQAVVGRFGATFTWCVRGGGGGRAVCARRIGRSIEIEWLAGWLTGWLADWLAGWLAG